MERSRAYELIKGVSMKSYLQVFSPEEGKDRSSFDLYLPAGTTDLPSEQKSLPAGGRLKSASAGSQ